MKGSHRVIVESKKIKYDFVIRRNITILPGETVDRGKFHDAK